MKKFLIAKTYILINLTVLFAISFPCTSKASHKRAGVGLMPDGFAPRPIASATEAADYVRNYIKALGVEGLHVSEVLEFSDKWFVYVDEDNSQMSAFCLEVSAGGKIEPKKFPAMEPEMMWNQKYGHNARPDESLIRTKLDLSQARSRAEKEIPKNLKLGHPKSYYGYYLFPLHEGDSYAGEAAVNGSDGKTKWARFPKMPLVKSFEDPASIRK